MLRTPRTTIRNALLPKGLAGAGALLKNTGYLALSTLIDRATSLVLTLLIAHVLGVADLGVYAAAVAFYNLVFAGAELGLVNFLTREIARSPERTNSYVVHASALTTICSSIVIAGSLCVVRRLGYGPELVRSISIVVFALLPATLNAIQVAVLVAYQQLRFQAYVSGFSAVLNLSVGIVLLHRGAGITSLLILFVVVRCALVGAYYAILNVAVCRLRWEFRWRFALQLIRDIRSFTAIAILAAAFTQPEVIILSLVTSTREVGFYSAGLRIVEVVNEVARIFLTNLFPELSRAYAAASERFNQLRAYASRVLLAVAFPAAAGLIVVAKPLLGLLYGDDFRVAATTLRILALGIPLLAVWAVLWRVLAARYQQNLVLRVQVISVVARIGAASLFGWAWGRNGAAVALVVAFALLTALYGYYVRQGDDGGSVFDVVRGTLRFAVAAAAMAAVGLPAARHLQLWILITLCLATYGAIVVVVLPFARQLRVRAASIRRVSV